MPRTHLHRTSYLPPSTYIAPPTYLPTLNRPKKNAIANKAKGGGYEDASQYDKTRIEFMDIENIHAMR